MSCSILVIQDGKKYDHNKFSHLTACEVCGNTISNTQLIGDETCLFHIEVQCRKCNHKMYGFTHNEMDIRFKNKFTPMYCNPIYNIEIDEDTNVEMYLNNLDFLRSEFKKFAIEYSLCADDIDFVNVIHLGRFHRTSAIKQVNMCKRKIHEYSSRKHQNCFMCGSSENLEHHHIIPVSEGGNSSSKNIISLCRSCHMRTHSLNRMAGRV